MHNKTKQKIKFTLSLIGIILLGLAVWYGITLLDPKFYPYILINIFSIIGISVSAYIVCGMLYEYIFYRYRMGLKISILLTPILLVIIAFIGKYIWILQNTPISINQTFNIYFDTSAYVFLFMLCIWSLLATIGLIICVILILFFIVAMIFGGIMWLWEFFGEE